MAGTFRQTVGWSLVALGVTSAAGLASVMRLTAAEPARASRDHSVLVRAPRTDAAPSATFRLPPPSRVDRSGTTEPSGPPAAIPVDLSRDVDWRFAALSAGQSQLPAATIVDIDAASERGRTTRSEMPDRRSTGRLTQPEPTPVATAPTADDAAPPGESAKPSWKLMSSAAPGPTLAAPFVEQVRRDDDGPHWSTAIAPADTSLVLAPINERLRLMTEDGFRLASRGALYSARQELRRVLATISQAIDAHYSSTQFSEALREGFLALDEADDFLNPSTGAVVNVAAIVAGHRTAILKPYDLEQMPAILATQTYYSLAQERLTQATGGAPMAGQAFYGLGKIQMALMQSQGKLDRLSGAKAMAFHQIALAANPQHALAANELAVLLARFGQYQPARQLLLHSVALRPTAESWRNLAVVHQRLGETQLSSLAAAESERARASKLVQGSSESIVQVVDARTFAEARPLAIPGEPSAERTSDAAVYSARNNAPAAATPQPPGGFWAR